MTDKDKIKKTLKEIMVKYKKDHPDDETGLGVAIEVLKHVGIAAKKLNKGEPDKSFMDCQIETGRIVHECFKEMTDEMVEVFGLESIEPRGDKGDTVKIVIPKQFILMTPYPDPTNH